MAVAKKTTAPAKLTAAEARKRVEELETKLEEFKSYGYCPMCDSHKKREHFYVSTDPLIKGEISFICKECAKKLAVKTGEDGREIVTKESAQLALRYLNKPFYSSLWDSSVQESENLLAGKTKSNPWMAYVKNISMGQYNGETYFDSDFFRQSETPSSAPIEENVNKLPQNAIEEYEKNKADVTRLLGYDPFEMEQLADQPFLYSQLLGLMDTGGDENDDMLRNSSCITIVRGFLQASKIDNTITGLMMDTKNVEKNSATIKSLQDSKQKIMNMVTNLAAESCISLKNNKNAKKGENTWTGKIKKIKDINLREGEVNGFDIATCRGMQQVQEISDASIMKQLALDESEWADMVAEMRVVNVDLRKEKDAYQEINRILLRENLDLRDTLRENDLLNEGDIKNLKDLYSVFADYNDGDNSGDDGGNSNESE